MASNTTKKDREWFRNWLSRREDAGQRHKKKSFVRLQLEQLESRDLLSGVWTALKNVFPDFSGSGNMMLLTNGTVMVQESNVTNRWDLLTPDPSGSYVNGTWSSMAQMITARHGYASNVLPSGKVFVVGGENPGSLINLSETYDPAANLWTANAAFPQSNFGDDPTEILPNGNILAGYIWDGSTYIYNPTTNSWSSAATKLGGDRSDEETWIKLIDGSILSYDVNGSHDNHAQRYIPSNEWVDAGLVPVPLTSSPAYELGPALLLPDGQVFQVGATNQTALYTPPTTLLGTGTWAAGPSLPAGMGADDAPGAILPNGHVLFAADQASTHLGSNGTGPTEIFDFDGSTLTQVTTPPALTNLLNIYGSFTGRMLMLPNGQLLYAEGYTNQLYVYTPDVTSNPSWQPTISSVTDQGGGNFLLTGTRLTGISEGASFGDDAEMSSNYPIVRLTDGSGNVFYAKTTNWSYTGVSAAGDTTVQTVDFALPKGLALGNYTLTVIANGIPSASTPFTVGVSKIALADLSGAFNNTGIVNDSGTFSSTGGLDGSGHAISSNLITSPVRWNGVAFNIGAVNGANPNVVSAAGQVITLPAGKFGVLNLLATAINGNQTGQPFTVTYTDGTTLKITPSVSDWFTPPNDNGQSEAVTMPYRDNFDGSRDSRPFYVYGYSFALDSNKTVQSITLPNNSNLKIFAITLAPGQQSQPQVDLSAVYNNAGIVMDSSVFLSNGGVDAEGHALSSTQLHSSVVFNGNTFNIGPVGGNDVVTAAGQTIAVPAGAYTTLNLLAMGINGNQTGQTFTVTYTDGTNHQFVQSVNDWFTPPNDNGLSEAATMTYRDVYNGNTDNRPFYVYGYSFTIPQGETVQSITLPNNSNLKILAITMGTAVAPPAGTPVDLSGSFPSYGNDAMTTNTIKFPNSSFDGGGHSYSATLLTSTVAWNGLTFNLGHADANDDVEAVGQTLSLPAGTYASLNLLAATGYYAATNATFTVTYSDATTDTFTRSFSTWTAPQGYSGESTAVTMAYQNKSDGTTNNVTTYLYGYTFALNTTKQVKSITLANASSVKIFAITLAPVQNMSQVHSPSLVPSTTGSAAVALPSSFSNSPMGGNGPVSLVGERAGADQSSSYFSLFAFPPGVNGSLTGQTATGSLRPRSPLSTSDLAFLPEYPGASTDNTVGKKDNWDFQKHNYGLENNDESESLTPPKSEGTT